MKPKALFTLVSLLIVGITSLGHAAGILTPKGAGHQPIAIRDHHVNVVINNGFAQTEVLQTFYNPNGQDLEAIYSFPLPEHASLSEVTIYVGEQEIQGEVLAKQDATHMYQEERDRGNDAGLAQKRGYQAFDFAVSPVRAQDETRVRFVYYQPLAIDTGVGRYLYPLEEGGTDDAGAQFWGLNDVVENQLSMRLTLKSAYPVADVRAPGFEAAAAITKVEDGHYTLEMNLPGAKLSHDFLFYYRLQDNQPGRVDLIPYRADDNQPGTFMMVVTPGVDLQPLNRGADYVFVLDLSGSMKRKLATLAKGVVKTLGELKPADRFRIVTFNNTANELTRNWVPATPNHVTQMARRIESLKANGSTNLYAGLDLALKQLDDDRATSVVLVTDAVTNTGVIDPRDFYQLMQQYDVRIFGFLMGNSANWPLMPTITSASGGFMATVSNADDIMGQIVLAKNKIAFEALHDVKLNISGGVATSDVTDNVFTKVYRGQQLVIFGRYASGGAAQVSLKASLTGEDKTYTTQFHFPDTDIAHPEIERLWALARIEQLDALARIDAMPAAEATAQTLKLGLDYQLVTDETSMVVLSDTAFAERGVERRNQARVARERQAQAQRAQQPAWPTRVDQPKPMFSQPAPSFGRGSGGGGGAIDPFTAGLALSLAGFSALAWARRRRQS